MRFIYISLLIICMISCQTTAQQESKTTKVAITTSTDSLVSTTPDSLHGWEIIGEHEATPVILKPSYVAQKIGKVNWKLAGNGIEYAVIDAPLKCDIGDSKIRIARIDPLKAKLILHCMNQSPNPMALTAEEYAQKHNLVAVINSSMFGGIGQSVGFMKNFAYINNPTFGRDKMVIAFNPTKKNIPAFKIIDTSCEDWEIWKNNYHTYIQNIRMIGCDRGIKWSKQEKFWSTACIGEDSKGRALFIHVRSPYRVHDLSRMLLDLPIDIQRCCYLEGGPESSLYLALDTGAIQSFGSYETDFNESDNNDSFWQIPNVIGVERP